MSSMYVLSLNELYTTNRIVIFRDLLTTTRTSYLYKHGNLTSMYVFSLNKLYTANRIVNFRDLLTATRTPYLFTCNRRKPLH